MRVLTVSLAALLMVVGFTTEIGGFQERRMPPRKAVPIADRARVANVRVSPLSAGYLAYYGYAGPYARGYAGAPYRVGRTPVRMARPAWRPTPMYRPTYRPVYGPAYASGYRPVRSPVHVYVVRRGAVRPRYR